MHMTGDSPADPFGPDNILEHIADAMVVVDRDWRFRYVNLATERMVSKNRRDMLGRGKFELFPQVRDTPSFQHYQRAMRDRVPVEFEEYHPATDTWLEVRAFPTPQGLTIFFRDVSSRKRAEREQRRHLHSERPLEALADSAPDIIARFDRQGRHLYVNPAVEAATGLPREHFIGKTNRDLGLPENLCVLWEHALARAFTGQLQEIRYDFDFPSPGGVRHFDSRLFPEFAPDGSVASVLCIAHDPAALPRPENSPPPAHDKHRDALESLPHMLWLSGGAALEFNDRWYQYTGQSRTAPDSQGWARALHPDDLPAMIKRWHDAQASGREFSMELRIRRAADNTHRWHLARALPIRAGAPGRWVGTFTDIDELKRPRTLEHDQRLILELIATQQPLVDILRRTAAAVESHLPGRHAALLALDEGNLTLIAPTLPPDMRCAVERHPLLTAVRLSQPADAATEIPIVTDIASSAMDVESLDAAARHRFTTTWAAPLRNPDATALGLLVVYTRDARPPLPAERKVLDVAAKLASIAIEHDQSTRRLHYFAGHDPLTRLPNRVLFENRCDQTLALARRNPRSFALLVLDLDHFKTVNDTLGHEAGDQLLQLFAQRVQSLLRDSDTFARVGGDEFMLLLPELASPGDAVRVAQRLVDATDAPFTLAHRPHTVGVSIGVALYPDHGTTVADLQRAADAAMYEAKNQGRRSFALAPVP